MLGRRPYSYLLDTNVFSNHLKNLPAEVSFFEREAASLFAISIVTVAEVVKGTIEEIKRINGGKSKVTAQIVYDYYFQLLEAIEVWRNPPTGYFRMAMMKSGFIEV